VLAASELMGADLHREAGVGMAELAAGEDNVEAIADEEAGVAVAAAV